MHLLIALTFLTVLAACQTTTPSEQVADVSKTAPDAVLSDEELAATEGEEGEEEEQIVVINNDNPGISDTQDFTAVTERLTIEDDKALLEAQRSKYQVVEKTDLPERDITVNVVQYALTTTNRVGEKIYKRFNPLGSSTAKRNCKKFRIADDAQEAFLKAGGPKRDPKGLDPDGDGFACDWSPDSYRKLVKN